MVEIASRLVWLAIAAATVSVTAAMGPVVWRLSGNDPQVQRLADAAPTVPAARVDLQPIVAFAPFGRAAVPEAAAQTPGETGLNLTLMGVTVSTSPAASRAIISGGTRPVGSYAIGAQVTDSVRVAEIQDDHVTLDVDGRRELLSFDAAPEAAPKAGTTDLRNLIPKPSPAAVAAAAAPGPSNDPDAVIARYRMQIQQNAQDVLDRLGLVATDQGYRIAETAASGVLQAGFRPGDLVTTVNGRKVGDTTADKSYFDEVAASGRARVELERDGQTIVMSFPLR